MLSMLFLLAAANVKISTTEAKPSVPPRVLVAPRPSPLDAMAHGVVRLLPAEAVIKAADAAPAPVSGVFDLSVLRADMDRGSLYLNSETDYRDQRNLSIVIPPPALPLFKKRIGEDLIASLRSHRILVLGQARRVRIDLTQDGKPTGKYYYQTHVLLVHPNQLQIVN